MGLQYNKIVLGSRDNLENSCRPRRMDLVALLSPTERFTFDSSALRLGFGVFPKLGLPLQILEVPIIKTK